MTCRQTEGSVNSEWYGIIAVSVLSLSSLGRAVPERRSLVVTVDSVYHFVHEKRCSNEYCDGYLVNAHDDSIAYVLICAESMDGDSDFDKQYNKSEAAKNCRPVSIGRWAAKTDDRDFF